MIAKNRQIVKFIKEDVILHKLLHPDQVNFLLKYSEDELCHLFFRNFRRSDKVELGLRLSLVGYDVCKLKWQAFEMAIEDPTLYKTPSILVFLDRSQTMPYYLSKDLFATFCPNFAMTLKLSGDLPTVRNAWETNKKIWR